MLPCAKTCNTVFLDMCYLKIRQKNYAFRDSESECQSHHLNENLDNFLCQISGLKTGFSSASLN